MTTLKTPGPEAALEIKNFLAESFGGAIAEDVRKGLRGPEKFLYPKYFYDAEGSRLFEEICTLPEYYPTRTEMNILKRAAPEVMNDVGGADIVELGSGSNWKIRTLIDSARDNNWPDLRYVPVDVSSSAIEDASGELIRVYPGLKVMGVVADFTRHLEVLDGALGRNRPRLYLFLGSTLGNFPEPDCDDFLKEVSGAMSGVDRFLVGLDMVKDRGTLEAAYNDSRGVTERFNKNILRVLNSELGSGFDPEDFDHRAVLNDTRQRIEMRLVARRDLRVEVPGAGITVEMEKGESILTETSRKFTREGSERMFTRAGLEPDRWYTDERGWFSVVELKKADA